MSIKKVKKVVKVKKYEEQEVDEHYCDVCETELLSYNTGSWYAVSYCGGEVTNEWSCALDICSKCTSFYDDFVRKKVSAQVRQKKDTMDLMGTLRL